MTVALPVVCRWSWDRRHRYWAQLVSSEIRKNGCSKEQENVCTQLLSRGSGFTGSTDARISFVLARTLFVTTDGCAQGDAGHRLTDVIIDHASGCHISLCLRSMRCVSSCIPSCKRHIIAFALFSESSLVVAWITLVHRCVQVLFALVVQRIALLTVVYSKLATEMAGVVTVMLC